MSILTTSDPLLEWLQTLASNPWAVAVAIIIATLILEDAATIAAALLAADGHIHPGVALSALYIGIVIGDLALYGMGRAAARWTWVQKHISMARVRLGRRWLNRRLILTLFGARSVPGLRVPTYTASGFVGISFTRFALIAIGAAAVWSTFFFGVVYTFGAVAADILGPWMWAIGAILLLIAIFLPRIIMKMHAQKDQDDADPNLEG